MDTVHSILDTVDPLPTFAVAYNNIPPAGGAPWDDRKIVHNDVFLPQIMEVHSGQSYGLLSTEREWIPEPPPGDWGDYIDKSIGDKTWLMSVTYVFARTQVGDANEDPLPFDVIPGSLNIGWTIPGDINGDCSVNVLDMLFVRNSLQKDVYSSDYWKADINRDRQVNVLDMILVRNELKSTCP